MNKFNCCKMNLPQWRNVDPVYDKKRELLKNAFLGYLDDFIEQGMCTDEMALGKFKNMRKILMGGIIVSYDLLRTTEGILQQVKYQVNIHRQRMIADQRLSRGIIEILESDEEDLPAAPAPERIEDDDEIVYRVPSPVCVADLEEAQRRRNAIFVADDGSESDCEVIEHDARNDIIEIRESPEREIDNSNSTTDTSSKSTSRTESPAVNVPKLPSNVTDTSILTALQEEIAANEESDDETTSDVSSSLANNCNVEQRNQMSPVVEDEIELEKERIPARPKPGISGQRRKSVTEESISTYKLKKTALKPASAYAKPKAQNVVRKTLSVKEKTKPAELLPRYNPLDEAVAVSKVKARIYRNTYLDPNNEIKQLAAGKIPLIKEKNKENENNSLNASPADTSAENSQDSGNVESASLDKARFSKKHEEEPSQKFKELKEKIKSSFEASKAGRLKKVRERSKKLEEQPSTSRKQDEKPSSSRKQDEKPSSSRKQDEKPSNSKKKDDRSSNCKRSSEEKSPESRKPEERSVNSKKLEEKSSVSKKSKEKSPEYRRSEERSNTKKSEEKSSSSRKPEEKTRKIEENSRKISKSEDKTTKIRMSGEKPENSGEASKRNKDLEEKIEKTKKKIAENLEPELMSEVSSEASEDFQETPENQAKEAVEEPVMSDVSSEASEDFQEVPEKLVEEPTEEPVQKSVEESDESESSGDESESDGPEDPEINQQVAQHNDDSTTSRQTLPKITDEAKIKKILKLAANFDKMMGIVLRVLKLYCAGEMSPDRVEASKGLIGQKEYEKLMEKVSEIENGLDDEKEKEQENEEKEQENVEIEEDKMQESSSSEEEESEEEVDIEKDNKIAEEQEYQPRTYNLRRKSVAEDTLFDKNASVPAIVTDKGQEERQQIQELQTTTKKRRSDDSLNDESKELPTKRQRGRPKGSCKGQSGAKRSKTPEREEFYDEINDQIDPEGLLEPMKKKVRVLRRKSSSYEEDEDEIPIAKRRKSCDSRKKKRGRKPKGKGIQKAKTQKKPENPEDVVIKTEPTDVKSETEFYNIINHFPTDLKPNGEPVPTSFAGILDKNARNGNAFTF